MFNNDNLRSIVSQGLNHKVGLQIEDSIPPVLWNRCKQHLTISYGGHAAYDRRLLFGFNVDRSRIPYQSYMQRSSSQHLGDLALLIPILRSHRYDHLQDNARCRRLVERIYNTLLRPSSLESQILKNLQQQANVGTLQLNTNGVNTLEESLFCDLTFFRDRLDG